MSHVNQQAERIDFSAADVYRTLTGTHFPFDQGLKAELV